MKGRMIRICSAILMLCMLFGCSINPNPTTTDKQPVRPPIVTEGTQPPTPTEPAYFYSVQYLPAEVDNPDDLPVLKWVCLTNRMWGGGKRVWHEAAAHEINEILEQKGMQFRLQFILLTTDQFMFHSEWFLRQEALDALGEADLIYGYMDAERIKKLLSPITDYANGMLQPSLKNAVPSDCSWYADSDTNDIYAYETLVSAATTVGWQIEPIIIEKYGLEAERFLGAYWELDAVFREVYEKNGNKPFLYICEDGLIAAQALSGDGLERCYPRVLYHHGFLSSEHTIGSCFAIDYSTDTPTIVNYLEKESVRANQTAVARYKDAGYLTGDPAVALICYDDCPTDSVYTDASGVVFVPVSVPISIPASEGGYVSGIASKSKNKEAALDLLSLIAEDADFRMHLFYGKEGRDYTIANGYYQIIENDGQNYSLDFISPLSYFCGLTTEPFSESMVSPGTNNGSFVATEGKSTLETYQTSINRRIDGIPVTFDYSRLGAELDGVKAVLERYFSRFSSLSNTEYDQMLAEIRAAGGDKIQAELQRQLDAWLEAHPDWSK